ncbi:heat shock 70 kDa protein 12B-like [Mercenaria mercenaria]|uniref:heat shock 70 kDa protein 12B-like n=1 Tax=Mercenaria mercenaria TaxID=6596 RepID=UPI00234F2F47|nr:heat shock 70 kDa protein 12B-like [Mercenaria mercenaria]
MDDLSNELNNREEEWTAIDQTPDLVVAVDIGTFASGYAFQWREDFEHDTLKIYGNKHWSAECYGSGLQTYKTPTCLLLDQDGNFKEFGSDADKLYSNCNTEEETEKPDGWENYYFFRHFKMALYNRKMLSDATSIETVDGKQLPAIDVFSKTIEFFRNKVKDHFEKCGTVYIEENTKWIITVPAIWDESAKQLMKRAALKAGCCGQHLDIALEPECAAIYCSKLSRSQTMVHDTYGEKIIQAVRAGSTIMIVDIGGGTVDISVMKINGDGTMKQVYKSGGGPWGGVKVNEKVLELLSGMIGREVMSEFSQKYGNDEYDLRMEIEVAKRKVKSQSAEEKGFQIHAPHSLISVWQSKCENYKELLRKYDVEFKCSRFVFQLDKIRAFFEQTIKEILKHVTKVLQNDQQRGIKPIAVIVVGGFSESEYVVDTLREGLKEKRIPVLRPQDPEKSVLNGAVLFGQNCRIIESRIMTHTYGIAMTMEFNEQLHSEDEKYEIDDEVFANNVFRKHVTEGDSVELDKWINSKEYYPTYEDESEIQVYVFTSDKRNPIHTTEEGCKCIGHFDVKFADSINDTTEGKKSVKIEFNFGGTLLRIRAVTTSSGRTSVKELQIKNNEMFS